MNITPADLAVYAAAVFALFMTPGPVWLALGVAIGDTLWALVAALGLAWVVSSVAGLMGVLRWGAAALFVVLGMRSIRRAGASAGTDEELSPSGRGAGFAAGLAAILGNPKAILFYMGALPGFFDLPGMGRIDIAAIAAVSAAVPLLGNLALAAAIGRASRVIVSTRARRRLDIGAGAVLIAVGASIPLLV